MKNKFLRRGAEPVGPLARVGSKSIPEGAAARGRPGWGAEGSVSLRSWALSGASPVQPPPGFCVSHPTPSP